MSGSERINEQDHRALLRLARGGANPPTTTTDFDVLRKHYRFTYRDDDDDESTWGARMARRYFDKLHKEYVLADLSRSREGKVGLRWRVEREVIEGKGQYSCGSLGVSCTARQSLASYELNFKYREGGEVRNELVKVRLCPRCKELLDRAQGKGGGKEGEERHKKEESGRKRGEEGRQRVPAVAEPPPPPPPEPKEVSKKKEKEGPKREEEVPAVGESKKRRSKEEEEEEEASKKHKTAAAMAEMDELIKNILEGKEDG